MRATIKIMVFAILAALIPVSIEAADIPSPPEYNVIIISMDGLQTRHLKSHGYHLATTPNLGRFLSKVSLFKKAVSPAPWTVPSHTSIFTSWYPSEHKVVNKFVEYSPDEKSPKEVKRHHPDTGNNDDKETI